MMSTSSAIATGRPAAWPQVEPAESASISPASIFEIMHRQATINIGVIGHVAHGKSTLVRAITGTKTMRHKVEMARNITIKLGYADSKIYRCDSGECLRPGCYKSCGSSDDLAGKKCRNEGCDGKFELLRHVSFVDCPGHEVLMRTMMSGASVMDVALLLVSADEACPQPQTQEHLAALASTTLKPSSIIVIQNKVDLVGPEAAAKHAQSVLRFLKGTVADSAPIIPISAQFNINIDAVLERIAHIPPLARDFTSPACMTIVRSFDINRPGYGIEDLKGGVAGGSLLRGVLRLHDDIEIRPGLIIQDEGTRKIKWKPLLSKVESLSAELKKLELAVPGGLIGVGTKIAPELCRGDRLVGQVIGQPGTLPRVFHCLTIEFSLLIYAAGENEGKVTKLSKGGTVKLNIASSAATGTIRKVRNGIAEIELAEIVCADVGEKVSLSRKIGRHWRLIGSGKVAGGEEAERFDNY